ncbi:octaprenyl diphosphate synthase [Alkalilimnicola sp. S0819]|uniref:octaprenyl diphosphate synthase n=1 Tax=Alkalilimnicola sp. S0819 TaxID=2613922 RepID=UPI00126221BE|nr:octaprenyl diphosphate synthase [Alkalilimnicola sp. S0819]KAB7623138.1 octaprenyl diphosphate synthase [Alkalilimnicola sp. S0819]MPQ16982.1 octaprenyl diphosphate synthase [Alkalilimnicola sp. S0819]
MDINALRELVADDVSAVDRLIQTRLSSDVALINQLGAYIINSGGKRLRPLLVLLAARACGHTGQDHIQLAAVVEFIHTSTLLHDDVVDASELRRGRDTANHIWGNEASVLVGDFLYSRSFEMMVEVGRMDVMAVLAAATNTIAAGEVMQLLNCNDPDVSEERYLEVIYRKTAALFEAGCRLGGVISDQPQVVADALADYGRHVGTAFQLVDDLLDYTGSAEEIGKNVGDDLAEGKPTMPLIYAMRTGSAAQAAAIRIAIEQGDVSRLAEVREAIENTGAIAYTRRLAQRETDAALACLEHLPANPYRQALEQVAKSAVDRSH